MAAVLLGKTAMTSGRILACPRGDVVFLLADRSTLAFPKSPAALASLFLVSSSLMRRRGCWDGSTGVFSLSALLSLCPLRAATLLEYRRPLLSERQRRNKSLQVFAGNVYRQQDRVPVTSMNYCSFADSS